jgi:hypothetical protein
MCSPEPFPRAFDHFPLPFSIDASDESSCAKQAQKRIPTRMTTSETNATDKAADVAAQGAHVAQEKAPAKKAASHKKGATKAKKAADGAKQGAKARRSARMPRAGRCRGCRDPVSGPCAATAAMTSANRSGVLTCLQKAANVSFFALRNPYCGQNSSNHAVCSAVGFSSSLKTGDRRDCCGHSIVLLVGCGQ